MATSIYHQIWDMLAACMFIESVRMHTTWCPLLMGLCPSLFRDSCSMFRAMCGVFGVLEQCLPDQGKLCGFLVAFSRILAPDWVPIQLYDAWLCPLYRLLFPIVCHHATCSRYIYVLLCGGVIKSDPTSCNSFTNLFSFMELIGNSKWIIKWK